MASNFDTAAATYDTTFSFSTIGKAQRERVYHFLEKEILSQDHSLHILELNCGTGEDAQHLTKQGHTVLATDISEGMIAQARQKYNDINFAVQDINTIRATTFPQQFDLIFSNFGGLNCLSPEQLQSFLQKAPQLLKHSGKLCLVIMPKACLWELVYFLAKAQFKKAFRRNNKKPVLANVDGVDVPTWYYDPKHLERWTIDTFKVKSIAPIGIAIPPSYLEPFFKNKKGFLKFLKRAETYLTSSSLSRYADHYSIILEKR